ncbi:MAG: hypothetical protein J0L77_06395 [Alphaproteobacteria bacterium]|nr:hypothetical protein [Alphaproteobacteria bacterium]
MKALHQIASDYRVTVNGKYGSRPSDKARIQISIGNPKYEGAKLLALTEWCATRFKETEIIVSDTLQRHNLLFDTATSWNITREEGDKWLRRNAVALEGCKIVRWDELLHHEDYTSSLECIEEGLQDKQAQTVFLDMVEGFSTRRNLPIEKCTSFLKEELAIFHFMMQEPAVDIYAGSWISKIFEALSMPVFKDLHCLEVDFERKKAV